MTDFFEDINDQQLDLAEEEGRRWFEIEARSYLEALINKGYLVRRGDHEALATTLRDAVAWLRYVHEGAMTKALLHNVYDCDICQFIERWS